MFRFKQVIIIRSDLKMSIGKIAVQAAHASVSSAEECKRINIEWFNQWFIEGQKKIVLKVQDLEELLKIYDKARSMKFPVALIEDAGLTELEPGTITALGIGPAPSEQIDKITGNLPLL